MIGPSPINTKVTGAFLITLAGLGSRGTLLGRFRCAKTLLTKGAGALFVPHAELDPRGKIGCAKISEAEATRTVFIDLAGLNPSRRIGYTKTP